VSETEKRGRPAPDKPAGAVFVTVQPLAGDAPLAARWLGALGESRRDLVETVADLTDVELHAALVPGAHSIAALLRHVAGVELWWVRTVLLQSPLDPGTAERFGLSQGPGTILPPPREWGLPQLLALLDEAHGETCLAFRGLDDVALQRPDRPWPGGGRAISPEWILYNLLDHLANHRGQIAMLKRLIRHRGGETGPGTP